MSNIGRVIYGFCGGFFGRDSYSDKRIEAEGIDWVVARAMQRNAEPEFASFDSPAEKQHLIDEWASEESRLAWD